MTNLNITLEISRLLRTSEITTLETGYGSIISDEDPNQACTNVLQTSFANSKYEDPDHYLMLNLKIQFISNARYEFVSPVDTSHFNRRHPVVSLLTIKQFLPLRTQQQYMTFVPYYSNMFRYLFRPSSCIKGTVIAYSILWDLKLLTMCPRKQLII